MVTGPGPGLAPLYGSDMAIDQALDRLEAQLQEEGRRVVSAVHGAVRRREWSSRVPYGPYIAVAAAIWIFAGKQLIEMMFAP